MAGEKEISIVPGSSLKLCETWYYLRCFHEVFVFFLPPKKPKNCILQISMLPKDINLPSKFSLLRWMLLALKHRIAFAFCLLA